MFHGKYEKHEDRKSKRLTPSLRFQVDLKEHSIAIFANWMDQRLAELEEKYDEFKIVTTHRVYFPR